MAGDGRDSRMAFKSQRMGFRSGFKVVFCAFFYALDRSNLLHNRSNLSEIYTADGGELGVANGI